MDLPFEILPIGGLGEIGMNCMLIGHHDRWIMIDCGVQFPDSDEIGTERKLPDFRYLANMRDRIEAVVITHGHEDHIGALPWVLPVLDPETPIFASSFTRLLIERRTSEHGVWRDDLITLFKPGERFHAGPFEIEPIRVTHSIPDCCSLVLRCEDATILHTGDWKIDPDPLDGEHFDHAAFERVGDEGVTVLLSDSTNIRAAGRTRPERAVQQSLLEHVEAHEGRVIVTQFASNLHRLRALCHVAEVTGRRLAMAGRSLHTYLDLAQQDGRAPIDPTQIVDRDHIGSMDPNRSLVVTTGSQGERNAALWRAAEGRKSHLNIGKGDLVLHSARVIPGNESNVYRMFNRLALRGAEIIHGRSTGIHASGHARADELAEMLRLVRPGHFIPLHGEYTFLQGHARLAQVSAKRTTTVLVNGEVFGFQPGPKPADVPETARVGFAQLDELHNDGPATGDREEMRLGERKKLAWNGVAVVDLLIERGSNGLANAEATVTTRGMWTDEGRVEEEMARTAQRSVFTCPPKTPVREIEEVVKAAVRRVARRLIDKRPEVIVVSHRGRAV